MSEVHDVVCVHGLGGTPAVMAPVAVALRGDGWDVAVPLLPGHGTTPDALLDVTWDDWVAAIPPARIVVGQSMGGSLALAVAAAGRAGHGVVCINAVAYSDPDTTVEGEWIDAGEPDIRAPGVDDASYRRLPVTAIGEMLRGVDALRLEDVRVPVLVVTSADDAVVDPYHSDMIASRAGGPVERLRLPRSGHVATLDLDAQILIGAVCAFVSRALSRPR